MKNKILTLVAIAAFAVITYFACSTNSTAAAQSTQTDPAQLGEEVSVHTVAALKGKKDVIVLDVREPFEYENAHIPDVVLIPKGKAIQRKAEYIKYKTVLITCRSGNRSGQVVEALRAQGHTNVHNMLGGIKAWKSAGLPVEP